MCWGGKGRGGLTSKNRSFFSELSHVKYSLVLFFQLIWYILKQLFVDSRQNKKARNFMFFCSYIIQFLLSFSKTIRRCYRMNEARFSLIHFFIIMTIYLFHCEELYGCLNFAGLHSMRGRWYCLEEREDISLRLLLNQM